MFRLLDSFSEIIINRILHVYLYKLKNYTQLRLALFMKELAVTCAITVKCKIILKSLALPVAAIPNSNQ